MSRNLREAAQRWLGDKRAAVVIEVADALGSAPREAGTRMLVSTDDTLGTVGGGHLEWRAIARARAMLRAGELAPHTEHCALGPALGQCCGGAVTLAYAPLDAAALVRWPLAAPRFHLQLFGAGHVGRAIATALAPLDVVVDWIDEREEEFPVRLFEHSRAWPARIRRVCIDAVEGEVRLAPPGAYFLVLTHRHDLDLRICEAIVARADVGFFGLIGSKTKRARFVHALAQRGVAQERIAAMVCPIGLAGIDGKQPEVIAASVVAQLLMASTAR